MYNVIKMYNKTRQFKTYFLKFAGELIIITESKRAVGM